MRRILIAVALVAIAGTIAALEYGLFPERVNTFPAPPGAESEHNGVLSQVSEKNFALAGISNVEKGETNTVEHLFGYLLLTKEQDHLQVLKSDFFDTENKKVLVSIFEIFPERDSTVSKAFSTLREKFNAKFENDLESGVNPTDEYGLHSFYFNLASSPEKAFLVVVTNERLLGFEYLKANHDRLFPLFLHLAPKISASGAVDIPHTEE